MIASSALDRRSPVTSEGKEKAPLCKTITDRKFNVFALQPCSLCGEASGRLETTEMTAPKDANLKILCPFICLASFPLLFIWLKTTFRLGFLYVLLILWTLVSQLHTCGEAFSPPRHSQTSGPLPPNETRRVSSSLVGRLTRQTVPSAGRALTTERWGWS